MISSTLTKQEFEKKFDFKMPKSDTVWTYNKNDINIILIVTFRNGEEYY